MALILFLGLMVFVGMPNIMEYQAKVFCAIEGKGLVKFERNMWDFKEIVCAGQPSVTVLKSDHYFEGATVYGVFEEDD